MDDLISRQQALEIKFSNGMVRRGMAYIRVDELVNKLKELPTIQPEPCGDAVSRQAAIDACIRVRELRAYDEIEEIKALPPVQPERKTGYWIALDSDSDRYEDIKCPFCGHTFTVDAERWCDIGFIKEDFKFCPNCGVKME